MPAARTVLVALPAAVLGAALALGGARLLEVGPTTTVVATAPAASADGAPPTPAGPRDVYRSTAAGIVGVSARGGGAERTTPFGAPGQRSGRSTGSGFVVGADGTIVTNWHVVEGAAEGSVRVQVADDREVRARVMGSDPSSDIAVLRVDPEGLGLRPLRLTGDAGVQVGDPVVAIGNPFGLARSLTAGVVSAKGRTITAPNDFQIDDVLQTDAAINPGNSGGPLLDARGRVIGITSQIAATPSTSGGGGNVGVGFAVPSDTLREVLPSLRRGEDVQRPYLGVSTVDVADLEGLDLPVDEGALVAGVRDGSPAQRAGLRAGTVQAEIGGREVPVGGDVVVAIDGRAVRGADGVSRLVADADVGDVLRVRVARGDDRREVRVRLATRPDGG